MKGQHALREFHASKITFMPPDDSWNIQGCASFAGEHGSKGHVADLTARWKDSQWYLSVISFVPFGNEKGGNLRECSIPQAGPNSASASDISPLALTMRGCVSGAYFEGQGLHWMLGVIGGANGQARVIMETQFIQYAGSEKYQELMTRL
jgi:hypothetical protein